MAKMPKTAAEQEGEISVSMVKFTMRGSDASLQKGLDTIKAAFVQAGFAVAPEVKQLRSVVVRPPSVAGEELSLEIAEEADDSPEVDDAVLSPAPAPKRTSTPKKPPNFKIMKDLKFDDVAPALDEFVAEKKPDTHLDKYLCIAYWFKHFKSAEDLTVEHFFTAYMNYRWPLPANAATPVNDLRHQKRQLFVAGEAPATSTISNTGERRVMEMGRAES